MRHSRRTTTLESEALTVGAAPSTGVTRNYRVLVVDDHPLFRQGLMKMLNNEPDLVVCGEADCAPKALSAIRSLKPDLVTVDIALKGSNGLELTKSIKAEEPGLPVLVISMHEESLYALRSLRAGASGYVMKQEPMELMMRAVRELLAGKIYISPELNNKLLSSFINQSPGPDNSITDLLTDRELEVFEHIGHGKRLPEIAEELNLSIKTVETHRAHIKEKLMVENARDVARLARDWIESRAT